MHSVGPPLPRPLFRSCSLGKSIPRRCAHTHHSCLVGPPFLTHPITAMGPPSLTHSITVMHPTPHALHNCPPLSHTITAMCSPITPPITAMRPPSGDYESYAGSPVSPSPALTSSSSTSFALVYLGLGLAYAGAVLCRSSTNNIGGFL